MDKEEYKLKIKESLGSFLGKEAFKGLHIKDDLLYECRFDDGSTSLEMRVYGNMIKKDVPALHEVISERLSEAGELGLLNYEMVALQCDNAVCEKFMQRNFLEERYGRAVYCSRRLIGNSELMKSDFENADHETLDFKIKRAKQYIKKAEIFQRYPENAEAIMKMEERMKKCLADENYEKAARIRDKLNELKVQR